MTTATDTRPSPAQLREKLLETADALRTLREMDAEKRSDTWADEVRTSISSIHTLDAELTAAERSTAPVEIPKGPGAAMMQVQGSEFLTPGDVYTRAPQYTDRHDRYRGGNLPDVEVGNLISFRGMGDDIEYRTLLSSESSDPAAGLWMPRGTPLPPQERRKRLFIRDLLSVVGTTLSSVPYIRELTPATNETGASSVAEGVAKPEVTMQFSSQDAPIRKIAAWIPVTSEVVEDAPTLRGYIDTRLAYMLALREEDEIIRGNGVSPDLRGIINTVGIQTQAATAGDMPATLGNAIAKIEVVDGEPDGIAMAPVDFWTMMITRHATFLDAGLGGSLPYGSPPTTVWGLPVVRTRSFATGKALVGSFRLGATLFDRQQTVIRVGDQHSDYFTLNKLVILAEERIGLAVHRPDFFVDVTI